MYSVNYDCGALLKKDTKYYDNVKVTVSDGVSEFTYEYLVVCDAAKLR
jgi:hypothetical protein